jgi:hypothetical protein
LDENIGRARTPNMKEAISLPYIKAIWKETLRVMPPIPLGESASILIALGHILAYISDL